MAKFCNSADLVTLPQIHAAKDSKNKFIYIITALNFAINKRPSQNTCLRQQSSIYSPRLYRSQFTVYGTVQSNLYVNLLYISGTFVASFCDIVHILFGWG